MKFFFTVTILIFHIVSSGQSNDLTQVIQNDKDGYQFSYPSTWKVKEPLGMFSVFTTAEGSMEVEAEIYILIVPNDNDSSQHYLDKLGSKIFNFVKSRPNFQLIKSQIQPHQLEPGSWLEFTSTKTKKDTEPSHTIMWLINKGTNVYRLTYNAKSKVDSKYLTIVNDIFNSFSFINSLLTNSNSGSKPIKIENPLKDQSLNEDNGNAKGPLIKIKADRLFSFNEGLAIIGNGTSNAVIDRTGKFIIGYNKFIFENFNLGTLEPFHGFLNGGCIVQNLVTNLLGIIDRKGSFIIPAEYILIYPFDSEGWTRATDPKQKDYFINKSGVKIPIASVFYINRPQFSRPGGLKDIFNSGPTRERALSGLDYFGQFYNGISPGLTGDGKFSFFNRSGKQVIINKFESAEPFYEGLACVSKKDEFGETKYGFIDLNGKLIIPYKFSKKPGNFFSGFAYVEPTTKTDFTFAFINKLGEIVLKQQNATPDSEINPHFEDGYFKMWVKQNDRFFKMIDSTGKEFDLTNPLKSKITGFRKITNASYDFSSKIQVFNYQTVLGLGGIGFVNLKTGNFMLTNYNSISPFDPTSGLALVEERKSGSKKYIDQSGNVLIGLESRSEW